MLQEEKIVGPGSANFDVLVTVVVVPALACVAGTVSFLQEKKTKVIAISRIMNIFFMINNLKVFKYLPAQVFRLVPVIRKQGLYQLKKVEGSKKFYKKKTNEF